MVGKFNEIKMMAQIVNKAKKQLKQKYKNIKSMVSDINK